MEHRMVQKDGTIRWFLSRGVAVRDDQDKPYRLIGCSVDITEYQQLED
jgi:PAS domain-containing protein